MKIQQHKTCSALPHFNNYPRQENQQTENKLNTGIRCHCKKPILSESSPILTLYQKKNLKLNPDKVQDRSNLKNIKSCKISIPSFSFLIKLN